VFRRVGSGGGPMGSLMLVREAPFARKLMVLLWRLAAIASSKVTLGSKISTGSLGTNRGVMPADGVKLLCPVDANDVAKNGEL
jgi:hypothetical protein